MEKCLSKKNAFLGNAILLKNQKIQIGYRQWWVWIDPGAQESSSQDPVLQKSLKERPQSFTCVWGAEVRNHSRRKNANFCPVFQTPPMSLKPIRTAGGGRVDGRVVRQQLQPLSSPSPTHPKSLSRSCGGIKHLVTTGVVTLPSPPVEGSSKL